MRFLVFYILVVVVAIACKKLDVNGEYVPSSRAYTTQEFFDLYEPQPGYFNVILDSSANPPKQEVAIGEYTVSFYPDSVYRLDGSPYKGRAMVKFLPLTKPSDFIFTSRPTETKFDLLESAGAFHIMLLDKDSAELRTECISLEYPYPSMSDSSEALQLFVPATRDNGTPIWEVADTSQGSLSVLIDNIDSVEVDSNFNCEGVCKIQAQFNNSTGLNWINCDAFWSSTAAKKDMVFRFDDSEDLVLDDAFVVVIFKDIRSVMQAYRVEKNKYVVRNIPVDLDIAVVAVAFEGISLYAGTAEHNTSGGSTVGITLQETTESEVAALLKAWD